MSSTKAKFDEQVKILNNKLADQLVLNKEMLTNDDLNVNYHTRHCEQFIDKDIIKAYKFNK